MRRKEKEIRDAHKKKKAEIKEPKKEIKILNNRGEVVRVVKN